MALTAREQTRLNYLQKVRPNDPQIAQLKKRVAPPTPAPVQPKAPMPPAPTQPRPTAPQPSMQMQAKAQMGTPMQNQAVVDQSFQQLKTSMEQMGGGMQQPDTSMGMGQQMGSPTRPDFNSNPYGGFATGMNNTAMPSQQVTEQMRQNNQNPLAQNQAMRQSSMGMGQMQFNQQQMQPRATGGQLQRPQGGF